MRLTELTVGAMAEVQQVKGDGSFRRRLLELGILPGTRVELVGVAPLGDPLELLVRGSSLSIRRQEAAAVQVLPLARADGLQPSAEGFAPAEVLERSEP